jgi:hypothetical protein
MGGFPCDLSQSRLKTDKVRCLHHCCAANQLSIRQGITRNQSRLQKQTARSVRGAEKKSTSHFFYAFTCGLPHARCALRTKAV